MWDSLSRLLGNTRPNKSLPTKADDVGATGYVTRLGKTVPVDDVFRAWTSGDLNQMLSALNVETNLIDRHFLLMSIVDTAYKLRTDAKMAELCAEIAETHLAEFPKIAPVLKEDMNGTLPRVSTFQHYATLLTGQGDFEKAIGVCEKAIAYGLNDGTKSGFEGRIGRIRKERAKRLGG